MESREGTLITPGVGTITDARGVVYSISTSKAAMENGAVMRNGSGTGAMAYHTRTLYGQDFATGGWYTWNDASKTWAPAPSPVSTAVLVSSVTIAHVNAQRVGVAFTVQGTFRFDGDNPIGNLQYLDDKGTAKVAGASVLASGAYAFSFVHPGYTKVGTYTLTVGTSGGATATSNQFQVVKA